MSDAQLDLFSGSGNPLRVQAPQGSGLSAIAPAELDDAALLQAIPASGLVDGPPLASEAGRRRLASAIPVLETYCRRFAGFGAQQTLREQVAALDALADIGGLEAARSVARIIDRRWVQGPTLVTAVAAAAQLASRLPVDTVLALLRNGNPSVRGNACRLARTGPEVSATLVDLLGDLHREVCIEAACALGRMGRLEARGPLKQALLQAPSAHVIEAVPPIADEECVVLLGQIARGPAPDLAAAATDALDAVEHPLSVRLLQRLGLR